MGAGGNKTKRLRQQTLVDIVGRQLVPSQHALVKEMQKRGVNVTQATVSRDVQELNLVKSRSGYRKLEDLNPSAGATIVDPLGTLRFAVTRIDAISNMLVVKTATGYARPAAMALEAADFQEAVGTIAGDDTVFVATRSDEEARSLRDKIFKALR